VNGLLAALRAAAEPTRLRVLALLRQGELTVSELVRVLGQSQPRVSRHLKLLTDSGLLERFREGTWIFHRIAHDGAGARLVQRLIDLLPADDEVLAMDRARLHAVKDERTKAAADYFRRNAERWDRLRSLHVDDTEVERALLALLPEATIGDLLDIGTGTGRMLVLFSPRARRAEGIDLSHEMLTVARINLQKAGVTNCTVRHGDLHQLPFPGPTFDAVTIHQVLHFVDDPAHAVAEAARVMRPGARLIIADFAPHDLEYLRTEHAHRRLGFADDEVRGWCDDAGLEPRDIVHLPGRPLTMTVWLAVKPQEASHARA
jgi:ArsR family transcriptional regulator